MNLLKSQNMVLERIICGNQLFPLFAKGISIFPQVYFWVSTESLLSESSLYFKAVSIQQPWQYFLWIFSAKICF